MAVEFLKYQGFNCVKLTFNQYCAEILYGRGCNIIEFKDLRNNLSLLHFPEPGEEEEFARSPQRFGSAILFPPNKMQDGAIVMNNIRYSLTDNNIPVAHGLLKEFPYELVDYTETKECIDIKFKFNSRNSVYYTAFSWLFECCFEYTLSEEGLLQKVSISNKGNTDIPFGLGFHTAFRIPQNETFTKDDYTMMVTCNRRWELDSSSYPTGNRTDPSQDYSNGNISPLSRAIAEHLEAATINDFHGAVITNQKTNTQFIYETDIAFSQWMIWNNNASDNYICIEPMTQIINAPNTTLPYSESGASVLSAGKTFEATNRMYVKS